MHHIMCVIGVDCPQFISQSQVVGLVEQQRIPAALLHVHVRFITHETKIQLHVQVAFCLLLAGALSQFPKKLGTLVCLCKLLVYSFWMLRRGLSPKMLHMRFAIKLSW